MRENWASFLQSKGGRTSIIFIASGLILFAFVWWPIQAERARVSLRQWEEKVAQKKTELNSLNMRYASLTALPVVDQWAKLHGLWRPPNTDDIITIQN